MMTTNLVRRDLVCQLVSMVSLSLFLSEYHFCIIRLVVEEIITQNMDFHLPCFLNSQESYGKLSRNTANGLPGQERVSDADTQHVCRDDVQRKLWPFFACACAPRRAPSFSIVYLSGPGSVALRVSE